MDHTKMWILSISIYDRADIQNCKFNNLGNLLFVHETVKISVRKPTNGLYRILQAYIVNQNPDFFSLK